MNTTNSNQRKIENLLQKFQGLGEHYDVVQQMAWRKGSYTHYIDIAILYKGFVNTIIEIPKPTWHLRGAQYQVEKIVRDVNCRYGVLCSGESFYIYSNGEWTPTTISVEELFKVITEADVNKQKEEDHSEREKQIVELLQKSFPELANNMPKPVYNKYLNRYIFEDEDTLFSLIFNEGVFPQTIYRYTSLETLMCMLKNGAYRMNGILGMNDKSEGRFFDQNVYGEAKNKGFWVNEMNRTYIASFSLAADKLNMWERYGNNGSGVCLEYNVSNNSKAKTFILSKAKYCKNKDKIFKTFKELIRKNVDFKRIGIWKHFFKSNEFEDEQEVRIVFFDNEEKNKVIDTRDWCVTKGNGIVCPYIELQSKYLPIKLTKIILGYSIDKANEAQLMDYVSNTLHLKIDVEMSKTKYYRQSHK